MSRICRPSLLIHGAASGLDQEADDWARARSIPVDPVPADWEDLSQPDCRLGVGRGGRPVDLNAGTRRNGWMRDRLPDYFVHFRGQNGTANMVRQMKELSKTHPVTIFSFNELL